MERRFLGHFVLGLFKSSPTRMKACEVASYIKKAQKSAHSKGTVATLGFLGLIN